MPFLIPLIKLFGRCLTPNKIPLRRSNVKVETNFCTRVTQLYHFLFDHKTLLISLLELDFEVQHVS
eukprot:UN18887